MPGRARTRITGSATLMTAAGTAARATRAGGEARAIKRLGLVRIRSATAGSATLTASVLTMGATRSLARIRIALRVALISLGAELTTTASEGRATLTRSTIDAGQSATGVTTRVRSMTAARRHVRSASAATSRRADPPSSGAALVAVRGHSSLVS